MRYTCGYCMATQRYYRYDVIHDLDVSVGHDVAELEYFRRWKLLAMELFSMGIMQDTVVRLKLVYCAESP
jgi:hypothetical protein